MKREVNLFAVGGIILLVILLVVAAVTLTRCGSAPEPTEPTVAEPTEAETQPTETEEPTEPPHVHEYEETVTDPDCISGGYTTFVCACGDSYVGNDTDALGHDWKDANCTEPKTCAACGVTEGRANGHKWDEGTVTVPAEENKEGEKLFTCTVCKATKTQAIPTLDHVHNYEETVEITPPTCTEDGYTTHTCRCGDSKVDSEVKALGHTMSEATCTKPEVCSVCGTTGKAAPGHKWNPATCTEPMTCSVCSEKTGVPKGHKETTVKGKDATCTETGLTDGIQCSVCKTWIKDKEVIPAKGHKEKTVKGKDPTCTETGLTDGIQCSVCNVWIKEQEVIRALGHTEETVKGKDSTCTETGLTDGKKCTVCQEWTLKQEVIKKKDHTEKIVAGYEPTCVNTGLTEGIQCSVCETWIKKQEPIPAKGHSEETIKGYDSTCTSTGLTDGKKCSVCGTITLQQEVIPALGHKDFNWVVKQKETCTVDGYKERTCSRCGTYEKETIDAPGHKEETIKGYAATYTKTGLTDGKKCTVCGTITVAQQTIPLLKATVTLEPNDGTVSPASIQVTYGEKYGNLPTPTRIGYDFNGWKMSGKLITNDTTVTTVGNHTLVASWTLATYTVTFDANGGSVSTTSVSVNYGGTYGTLPRPTRTNYAFIGWALNGVTIKDGATVTTAGNHTLVAQWLLIETTVGYYDRNNSNRKYIEDGKEGREDSFQTGLSKQALLNEGYTKLQFTMTIYGSKAQWLRGNSPYFEFKVNHIKLETFYLDNYSKYDDGDGASSFTSQTRTYTIATSAFSDDGSFSLRYDTEAGDWELGNVIVNVKAIKD